jgi:hypothetical protein
MTDIQPAPEKEEEKSIAPRDQLNKQVANSTYTRLEALLKEKKWTEADHETEKVMLQVAEQEERGFLMPEDFKDFPCEDLSAIDRLWVDASKGHFGFSVQKKIWEDCRSSQGAGKDLDRFCYRVGWKQKGEYVSYSVLRKDPLHSPAGELPTVAVEFWFVDSLGEWFVDVDFKRFCSLFSRIGW